MCRCEYNKIEESDPKRKSLVEVKEDEIGVVFGPRLRVNSGSMWVQGSQIRQMPISLPAAISSTLRFRPVHHVQSGLSMPHLVRFDTVSCHVVINVIRCYDYGGT